MYVPAVVTTLRRVAHEASFVLAALLRSLTISRPDLLLVVSPPLGLSIVAFLLSRWWRVPYVFHVADLQPDTARDLGMMGTGPFARFLYAVERFAYRHAARVSTLTEAMRARILAKGVPAETASLSDWQTRDFRLEQARATTRLDTSSGWGRVLWFCMPATWASSRLSMSSRSRSRADETIHYVLVGMAPCVPPSLRGRAPWVFQTSVSFHSFA